MASVQENEGEQIYLNIMPMLDIFSILILFLLMNFSTEPFQYQLHDGVELPFSESLSSLDAIPTVAVTKEGIFVNGNLIVRGSWKNESFQIEPRYIKQGAIPALYQALKTSQSVADKWLQSETGKEKAGFLTLEVDRHLDMKVLKMIMRSAYQADFISFKFMVDRGL